MKKFPIYLLFVSVLFISCGNNSKRSDSKEQTKTVEETDPNKLYSSWTQCVDIDIAPSTPFPRLIITNICSHKIKSVHVKISADGYSKVFSDFGLKPGESDVQWLPSSPISQMRVETVQVNF